MNDRLKITALVIAIIAGIYSTMGADIVAAAPWLILDLIR